MQAPDGEHLRHLILLRHAKADWPAGVPDRERPLAPRGRRDATAAGQWLDKHVETVDLIQHSDARRTTETCRLVLDELRGAGSEQIDVRAVGQIYEAEVADLIEVIHGFPISARTAMLVGHNPGVQNLVLHLARPDDGASTAQVSAKFPTSGLAVLAIAGPWSELGPGQATVERFVVPRG